MHTKKEFSIKDSFSICDQIRSFQQIWSHLLKKSLMENFIFRAVELTWEHLSIDLPPAELEPFIYS